MKPLAFVKKMKVVNFQELFWQIEIKLLYDDKYEILWENSEIWFTISFFNTSIISAALSVVSGSYSKRDMSLFIGLLLIILSVLLSLCYFNQRFRYFKNLSIDGPTPGWFGNTPNAFFKKRHLTYEIDAMYR